MHLIPSARSQDGGVIISAVITVAILASIAAMTLFGVTATHRNAYQAAGWRESLVAAESGAERALAELQKSIDDPVNAWTGWTVVDAKGNPAVSQTLNKSSRWPSTYSVRMTASLPPQTGETLQTQYSVVVDVPGTLAASGKRWNQSFRIRSTGVVPLSEAAQAVTDKRDSQLRRLSLVWDRTLGFASSGTKLTTPQATRMIEMVARPDTVYKYGLVAEVVFKLSKSTYIDGFNSNDGAYSVSGKYDPAKRTPTGGTILANRWKKKAKPTNATEKFDVGKATVYGDLLVKGSMKNVKNTDNVQGDKVTNVSIETPTNLAPVWPSVTANISKLDGKIPSGMSAIFKIAEKTAKAGGPAAQIEAKSASAAAVVAAKGMELVGGANPSSPSRFIVGSIDVDKKDESLVFSNPAGATESWIEIYLTGDMKVSKGGTLFISNGVHATVYLDGKKAEFKDTKKDGGGVILESGFAADFQLVGVEQSDGKKETDDDYSPKKRSGKITVSDSDFTGVINAPDWDVDFKPKDWDKEDTNYGGQLFGSVLGRKVNIGNGADYHFDEALNQTGAPVSYAVAAWNEIER